MHGFSHQSFNSVDCFLTVQNKVAPWKYLQLSEAFLEYLDVHMIVFCDHNNTRVIFSFEIESTVSIFKFVRLGLFNGVFEIRMPIQQ
jgi:hypothetical protein